MRYLNVDRRLQTENDNRDQTSINGILHIDRWLLDNNILVSDRYLPDAGAFISILAFRIFSNPTLSNGIGINRAWLSNIESLSAQSSGNVDLPFALQWAGRSHLFSFTNLTVWGLGLPLGILAWSGFLWMAWRIFRGELRHILLWGWTAAYLAGSHSPLNPTMRYQLPIYPLLCMMAAWFVF